MNKLLDPSTPAPDPHPSTNTTIPAAAKAAIEAGARAYAADTYRGTRGLDGQTVVWDTLTESDRAACAWKAQVVLTAALPVLAETEEDEIDE